MKYKEIPLAVIILLFSTSIFSGVYKWTDSEGNIHFGDRPVDDQSATEVKIRTNNQTGVTNSPGRKADREYLLKKIGENKEADAKKKKKLKAESRKRKRLCKTFKAEYQIQVQSNRTYSMDPDGKRTYLSDNERVARQKKLAKSVKKHCR